MISSLIRRVQSLPILAHVIGLGVIIIGFQKTKMKLDSSYAASMHPVDYFTGQTTFSGTKVKEYYTHMIEAGTLDTYWDTQVIDFIFIAGIFLLGLFLGTLIARLARMQSWAKTMGLGVAIFAMLGALFDALENLISFVMLSNPTGFADWIAIPYSSMAAIKFACITIAMLCVLLSISLILAGRVLKRPTLG